MDIIEFSGKLNRYIFAKDNYMVVSILSVESFDTYHTCVGEYIQFDKDKIYDFKCIIEENPKYGYQYKIVEVCPAVPKTHHEIVKFLSSNYFKGVGKKCAETVYKALGDDALELIRKDYTVLNNIGISSDQISAIIDGYNVLGLQNKPEITELLSLGFTTSEANIISNQYKEKTLEKLHENPYVFYYDCPYISLKNIHNAVSKLNIENSDELRLIADFIFAFKAYTFRYGHTYLEDEDLDDLFKTNIENKDYLLNESLKEKLIIKEGSKYYYKDQYYNEKTVAEVMNIISSGENDFSLDSNDIEFLLNNDIEYDDKQIDAINNFFDNNISIVSGGPGTGKTTIIKGIVELFYKKYPYRNLIVIAPTGRAAKRINEMCNVETKTIHSLLRWNKEYNYFTHNKDNPLYYDAIIIDEFSMVDNEVFARLLDANRALSKLCIIGDYNQLPSIREGELLKNFIDEKLYPTVILSKIFRQEEGNDVIKFANDIINDSIDYNAYNNDIKFYDINKYSYDKFINDLKEDFDNGLDFDDIQVLSPIYKHKYGVDELNNVIQDVYNPIKLKKDICDFCSISFRKNDKVLQLKNRSDYDLCNGDIGYIKQIDNENNEIMLEFNDNTYIYTRKELNDEQINLAYAITVHKAQGSEYKKVYLFIDNSHSHFVDKKILYTAISRSKSKLCIISSPSIIDKCLKRSVKKRKTSINEMINNTK